MSVDGAGAFARVFQTVERRVSGFSRARIFAGRLAQSLGRGRHVQQIVRDLKQEAERGGVVADRPEFALGRTRDERARARRRR